MNGGKRYNSLILHIFQLQKLLYSATLSSNPEKLQQLNLFQPRLYTSVVMATVNRKQFSQDTENTSEMLGAEADQAGKILFYYKNFGCILPSNQILTQLSTISGKIRLDIFYELSAQH